MTIDTDTAKAHVRAELRARSESIRAENDRALLASVQAGELDLAAAAALGEWMYRANLAELPRTIARVDRLIDQLAARTDRA